ncbi:MAG: hypothetical protein EBU59_02355 [Planctomycetia bacterium]|nr:hypothetical protein [Planctomycetia bacterium]
MNGISQTNQLEREPAGPSQIDLSPTRTRSRRVLLQMVAAGAAPFFRRPIFLVRATGLRNRLTEFV